MTTLFVTSHRARRLQRVDQYRHACLDKVAWNSIWVTGNRPDSPVLPPGFPAGHTHVRNVPIMPTTETSWPNPAHSRQIPGNSLEKSRPLKHSELKAGATDCVTRGQAASYVRYSPWKHARRTVLQESAGTFVSIEQLYWIISSENHSENHRQPLLQIKHPLAIPHARELTVDGSTAT